MLNSIQLGCPKKCKGQTCIDLYPEDQGVIADEAIHCLTRMENESVDKIYSKNMLEHITEVHELFSQVKRILKPGGFFVIITDNAAFLPYHIPIIHRWGFGAHSSNKYFQNYKYKKCGVHYLLFSKQGLINIFQKYGFEIKKASLRTFGARIYIEGTKK